MFESAHVEPFKNLLFTVKPVALIVFKLIIVSIASLLLESMEHTTTGSDENASENVTLLPAETPDNIFLPWSLLFKS